MKWSRAKGQDIVTIDDARTSGTLDGVVIDPTDRRVVSLLSDGRVVSWSDVRGVGGDAVTISSERVLREPGTELERSAADGSTDPLDKPVYTEDGFALGTLRDVVFDPASGSVTQLVLDDRDLPGEKLLGIGSFAVVVASTPES